MQNAFLTTQKLLGVGTGKTKPGAVTAHVHQDNATISPLKATVFARDARVIHDKLNAH